MHRFQSKSTILRFRMAASLLILKLMLIPLIAGVLLYSVIESDREVAIIALALGFATLLLAILQCVLALRTRCPLCMTPVLASKGCSKHRNARGFLGSYRLRVALGVLTRGTFQCPYCNESSVMEVRTRHMDSAPRKY